MLAGHKTQPTYTYFLASYVELYSVNELQLNIPSVHRVCIYLNKHKFEHICWYKGTVTVLWLCLDNCSLTLFGQLFFDFVWTTVLWLCLDNCSLTLFGQVFFDFVWTTVYTTRSPISNLITNSSNQLIAMTLITQYKCDVNKDTW